MEHRDNERYPRAFITEPHEDDCPCPDCDAERDEGGEG